ncbi:Glutamate synthase [NADPH] small chain [Clostridium ljungdahlii DSM 13528]|uniref:Glutamate synthase [NADPH] small chain n=1 Tax=Clostridium ljungdahlii (strain ATCC 55383 / DSM 13528 / PETC) TaxID=748727 RepID=D8GLA3_CLOLD|nr:pyridine nucleotide-disulfide oxidoreductase/dicluster-binding protein [Clostridium ljungdahlii]ADK15462.1 predicted Fe-S oxidoreductase [Clostridium ljungdahlii DSM 13528]OAA88564.1 Glutamate synthase [NADPH] small chain [Clostridium ljungdahlii DSM 13528]
MDLNKLLNRRELCIGDKPSACIAGCPLHMDVKAFIEEIQKGDFKKAYKIMSKKVPFARIIGSICDEPCKGVCPRNKLGGGINIHELERTAIELGFSSPKKSIPIPKNEKNVAVIGAGISGIVATFDLDKKGYQVTVYEKSDKIGGRLWSFQGEQLSKQTIEEELEIMNKDDITIKFNEFVDEEKLENILNTYDAVYIGTGTWEKDLKVNPQTFQVEDSSLFAGGRVVNKNDSVILSISSGRRAATSIDRYLQKTSLTAARENEGSYDTPLKLQLDDIETVEPIKRTSSVYNEKEAIEEAQRCLKCECSQCAKNCPHLRKYNTEPRKYIRQINHNENIVLGDHYANEMINSCTLCGLCGEVCPSNLDMKDIIQETRESMVEREKMPVSAHDFGLRDMEFSNSKHFSMVKNQPGYEKVKYMFYPGCQLPASSPEYIPEIYKYLMDNIKDGVGIMLGCCGAPADWAGRQDLVKKNMEDMKDKWEKAGKPTFILACSSCYRNFKKYIPDIKLISLWEVMDKYGIRKNNKTEKKKVLAVQDACSTRHNKEIHESIRSIADKLGYEIKELKFSKEKTKCCGYGGLVYFANREQSREFAKDRIGESNLDYLVYCAMCKDLFIDEGKKTFHILDLIYSNNLEEAGLRKVPSLSKRHENRALVKKKLLKEIWNEEMNDFKKDYGFKLNIPDNVQNQMEERLILLEDIEKAVDNAQKNKERFFNPENSHYLCRLRIGSVTYWVEYEKNENQIFVKDVYSHRMEVVEE